MLDIEPSENCQRNSRINSHKEGKTNHFQDTLKGVEIIDLTNDLSDSSLINFTNDKITPISREDYESSMRHETVFSTISDIGTDEMSELSIMFDENHNLDYSIPESPLQSTSLEDSKIFFSSNQDRFENDSTEFPYINEEKGKILNSEFNNKIYNTVEENQFSSPKLKNSDELGKDKNMTQENNIKKRISTTSSGDEELFNPKRKRSLSPEDIEATQFFYKDFDQVSRRSFHKSPRLVPDWVKEFDSDLIDELKDYI